MAEFLRFEDLPLDEQLALSASLQNELKSRPETRRGPGAKSNTGGDCTRYFKRTNPNTGRTEWKVLTGQPCGPDAASAPRPPTPTPTPPRPPVIRKRVCDNANPIIAHIEGLLQSGAGVYGGLGSWQSLGFGIIAQELPTCADTAVDLRRRLLELQNRSAPPGLAMPPEVPAAIQMYFRALAKLSRENWRNDNINRPP